ncbi:histidine kinase N-terminal 7TM domain-containing protein [Haloferax sp. DFSO60]|uniref:histidine kinase N-terminal 7TM domain-containing protein n=1 Tax=Haloferax sp. DFSO60 TaxID=3388652 RepID=UPI0039795479
MEQWLTPEIAILLMYLGVAPSIAICYFVWDDRRKPGVLWFIMSMATGGAWAFLFATFTLVKDPGITLALANFFWVMIPTAAATMFLLAYEFVFKHNVSRRVAAVVFFPIVVLFVLSWFNPDNLVFTPEYHVGADGFLYFPNFGGPVKIFVTKIYGYLLVFLAAGMFVGEMLRTNGVHRRQTLYLLVIFSMLILSTMVKVAGLVPVYFDPTSVVYSLSGVLFAFSITKHGLMKFVPVAREQTFQEVSDAIFVIDTEGTVVDLNHAATGLFGRKIIGLQIADVLCGYVTTTEGGSTRTLEIEHNDEMRYFSMQTSTMAYGRGLEGEILVLSEITALKKRESELDLLKQILSRVFRHNIRNDLNVIAGHAQIIRDTGDSDIAAWATRIHERSMKIVNQAEKAGKIESVFSYDGTIQRSLKDFVEKAADNYPTDRMGRIMFDVADIPVDVHPRFDLAVQELIDNALTHHTGPAAPNIAVFTEETDTSVTLVVKDDGPGLPPGEINVLKAGEETNLKHGSGIGLWLVHWIVIRSNGELLANVTDSGSRVCIRLPKPERENEQ